MGEEQTLCTSRDSRSRSRTPFLRSSCDRELCNSDSGSGHSHKIQLQYGHSVTAVAECTEEGKTFSFKYSDTAIRTTSVTGDAKALRKKKRGSNKTVISPEIKNLVNGSYRISKVTESNAAVDGIEQRRLTDGKTSDYSSEGEYIPQDTHAAFQLYKKSGDWWNVFPKTDYTYSEYSAHRKEIAPGIVNMPNMSRQGLHNQDIMSPTSNYINPSNMQKFSSSYERSRYSTSYSKQGTGHYDGKWARVLGAEYSANESIRRDHSSTNETHILAKIFTIIISYMCCITSSVRRNISYLNSYDIHAGSKSEDSLSMSFQERSLQWVYLVLGYVKFVDTWMLLQWTRETITSSSYVYGAFSRQIFRRLMKILILFLPTLIIGGLWIYSHLWDDHGVTNSLSLTESNEPVLTTHPNSPSKYAMQDLGASSPIKLLATSFISNLQLLWMWIPFHMAENSEDDSNSIVPKVPSPPVPVIHSSDEIRSVVKECTSNTPEVNVNDLVTNILAHPLFVSVLSSSKDDDDTKVNFQNILLKMNHMQEQLDQKTSEIEVLRNKIKSEVDIHFSAFSKEGREANDAVMNALNILVKQVDEVRSQHLYLENLIHIESSSRERSLLNLEEMLAEFKKKYSETPAVRVSNELYSNEDFSKFKLEVMKYVDDQFAKYDADKTGLPDYALESSGGSIVSTRCTETYQAKTAVFSLFGIPLWSPSINPRKIIQPGILPGECWAFKGSQGYVVIKLSKKVYVTKFSLEHTPKSLSPVGKIDSAPRNFSVWGLNSEMDNNGQLFGHYVYNQNGSSLQYFPVQEPNLPPYQFVELRIESNQGNLEYTCVYRFRVHGNVYKEENYVFGQHGN
ncbi:uncharacterized protein LOC124171797 isoform X2 [Ischnura elegans]|uniref:uncharacterized protein LOC124171797 isoform X2 n=1 Tax=Ischnura elegans TaxID=197161 RepID=UPI001ED8A5B9|nr:uncharacterized protein LOC124171797 isoform X2 [Ischnura elegans]